MIMSSSESNPSRESTLKSDTGNHTLEKQDVTEHGEDADNQSKASGRPPVGLCREIILVALLSTAQFATQVGVGQALAIIHVIGKSLGTEDLGTLSWFMAAYSLTVGTFILPSGRFGDVFGHKKMLIIGYSWFAIWSLAAGLAVYTNPVFFIVARALQGVGPAICLPNAQAILGRLYPAGPRKDMAFAIFGATAPTGSIIGALFASLFALGWWPWTFFAFAIMLAVTALAAALIVPPCELEEAGSDLKFWKRLELLDPVGCFTGVFGLVLFNIAWNQAPVTSWSSPLVLACLILGVLFFLAFLWCENKIVKRPLVPFKDLQGEVGLVLGCIACGWSCFGIYLYYTWQFFLLLRHATPLQGSVWYLTNMFSGIVAAILTGLLLRKIGPAPSMLIAMLAYAVGTALIATAPIAQTYWTQTFFCLLIVPFGMDISFPAATVMISDSTPREKQGIAASLVNTVVNYSISIGLGLAGTVDVQIRGKENTSEADLLKGFRSAWYLGIGLATLGVVVSLMYWFKMHRVYR